MRGTGKWVRRRPWHAAAVGLILLAGMAFAGWQYARSEWRQAVQALEDERPVEAQRRLRTCLRVWPYSLDVHLAAARADRLTGNFSGAEAHLNRCIQLNGGATERVQLEFLLIRVQTGQADELAVTLIEIARTGHPETRAILGTLARAYLQRVRYKAAFACLTEWTLLLPNDARPYQLRGFTLERLNNEKKAREDYHKALELDPTLAPVRVRIVEMLLEDKQAPDALPHLEILRKQHPDDPLVNARMGMCLFLMGRADEARPLMTDAVDRLPFDPALSVAIAKLALQDGDPVEAERRLRTVLDSDSSDTEALFVLASALQAQGRTSEAQAALADYQNKRTIVERINVLLREVPDDPRTGSPLMAELGQKFLLINRGKFGVYWLERALEGDPTNQPARQALADYYDRKGDATSAAVHRRYLRAPAPPPDAPKP